MPAYILSVFLSTTYSLFKTRRKRTCEYNKCPWLFQNFCDSIFFHDFSKPGNDHFNIPWLFQVFQDRTNPVCFFVVVQRHLYGSRAASLYTVVGRDCIFFGDKSENVWECEVRALTLTLNVSLHYNESWQIALSRLNRVYSVLGFNLKRQDVPNLLHTEKILHCAFNTRKYCTAPLILENTALRLSRLENTALRF